jgi:S-formylglutathione hydrolase FrmB
LKDILGSHAENPRFWKEHSAITHIEAIKENSLKIYLDCGKADFFLEVNRNFHKTLKERNIPHLYMESLGGHDVDYWSHSMQYLMAFVYGMFQEGDPSASAHPWTDAP